MRFKDVSLENSHLTTMLERDFNNRFVKIYERGDTSIIFSEHDNISHASLSNPKRDIKDSEIRYAIIRVMKTKITDVEVFKLQNGNIHIKKPLN